MVLLNNIELWCHDRMIHSMAYAIKFILLLVHDCIESSAKCDIFYNAEHVSLRSISLDAVLNALS